MPWRLGWLSAVTVLALCAPLTLRAQSDEKPKPEVKEGKKEEKKAPSYIRIERDKAGEPTAMQTAIVRFVPAEGKKEIIVDLVGVVHVGERAYYAKLNKALSEYDAVLYELVAEPGTRVPKGGPENAGNPIAMLQGMMTTVLRLESQLKHIDYTQKHFIHADLSPAEMAEAMKKRGDTPITVAMSAFADILRQGNLMAEAQKKQPGKKQPDIDPIGLLLDPQGPTKLKKVMAEQMLMTEGGGLGPTLNTLLISDRNAAAVKVLQKEIVKGTKKIAIFYGAAHMPDFEQRLREDLDLRRQKETWLTAWDLQPRFGVPLGVDLLQMLDKLNK